MTPKEKAEELYDEFLFWSPDSVDISKQHIRQFAIIVVDEILEALTNAVDQELVTPHLIYWSKVKKQLENL